MGFLFIALGVGLIYTGIKGKPVKGNNYQQLAGNELLNQEVEKAIGQVVKIGLGTYLKITRMIFGVVFILSGLMGMIVC